MAGDWIQIEHNLPNKPEVLQMSAILGMDKFTVVGRLGHLWSWFDAHTANGSVPSSMRALLDDHCACANFVSALEKVFWMEDDGVTLRVCKFGRYISKSAKRRALAARRKSRSRHASNVTKAGPEKRREEKSNKETPLPPLPPELDTAGFRAAWDDWQTHRREKRKPLTPLAARKQLKQLAGIGASRAIAAIEHSIASGYQGVFEDKDAKQADSGTTKATVPTDEELDLINRGLLR